MAFIVAIDGPTSSGKSTLARNISRQLGFLNIQTGAMYRCVAKLMLDNNIELTDLDGVQRILSRLNIEFRDNGEQQLVFLNHEDVTLAIRTKEVTDYCSKVASIPIVRSFLVEKQRAMALNKDVVMEGRDIGTNVFPNANLKIFLSASPVIRIRRRIEELIKAGEDVDYNEIAQSVYNWDEDAIKRDEGALKKAKDCICIDSTELTEEKVTELVIEKIKELYKEDKGVEEHE